MLLRTHRAHAVSEETGGRQATRYHAGAPRNRPGGQRAPGSQASSTAGLSQNRRPGTPLALDWADLDLESAQPSLLVRRGKGGKPRRQPLAPQLARELALVRTKRKAPAEAPVFCGLEGNRLQPTILAAIIHRPQSERASRSASPRTRSDTPPRPGSASRPETPDSSPPTSVIPTSRP
jgi:hypothetical protein